MNQFELEQELRSQEPTSFPNGGATEKPLNSSNSFNSQPQPRKPKLEPEALHGLAGEIVTEIRPYTEAHDVALLLNSSPPSVTSSAAQHMPLSKQLNIPAVCLLFKSGQRAKVARIQAGARSSIYFHKWIRTGRKIESKAD